MPALRLTGDDAKSLAVAIAGVLQQYDLTLGPKALAWLTLASAGGAIYGPRAIAIVASRKLAATQRRQEQPAAAAASAAAAGAPAMDFSADIKVTH